MTRRESYRRAAQIFRLLAHPVRLHILDELRRGEACVCHLQAILKRPQPYISQQLRVLREAGVVEGIKRGLFVYYRLSDRRVEQLLEEILGPAGPPTPTPPCACPRCVGSPDQQALPNQPAVHIPKNPL
ncbi:MAG TPA: helix-turn-helix transcriptional regulator [Thermoflexia bacterium]|jgi:ArsR family transcriptional regulator|nr:helix-turn-helix transcriptional regulator [Thermoflexia bacterium]